VFHRRPNNGVVVETQVKVNDDTSNDEIRSCGHFRCRDASRVAA